MDTRPIGFFDSGVGGLSIFREVRRLLPAESMVYLADNAHFPYGALGAEALCPLTIRLARFLLSRDVKLIVVACNTATVHALAHLRATFPNFPFVGVVPVVKPLAEQTRTGVIAIMVTPATADSPYLAGLIAHHAARCHVVIIPCPGLAELVEAGEASSVLITHLLGPITTSGADVVGLGCTHYPFLRGRIQRLLGQGTRVFDSGNAVARRVREVLIERDARTAIADQPTYTFYSTGDPGALARAVHRYLRLPATTYWFGVADTGSLS